MSIKLILTVVVATMCVPCWSASTDADRAHAIDLVNKGVASKDTDEQIALYKKAMSLDPNCYYAHSNLGGVYFSLTKYADSASEYAIAAKLQPGFNSYWLWGLSAYPANDMPSTITAYTTAIAYVLTDQKLKPGIRAGKLFLAEQFLGEAYQKSGQDYEAIAALHTAIAQMPLMDKEPKTSSDDPMGLLYAEPYCDLGFSLSKVKDLKGAIDAFNTSISYKDDPKTELGLGLAEYEDGDHFSARLCWRKVLRMDDASRKDQAQELLDSNPE